MEINLAYRTLIQMHGESIERDSQYIPDDTLIDWRPKPLLKVTPQPASEPAQQQPKQSDASKSAPPKRKQQGGGPFIWRWHYSVIILPIIWLTAIISIQLSQKHSEQTRVYVSDPETTLPRPQPVRIQPAQAGIGTFPTDTARVALSTPDSLANPVQ